MNRFFSKTAFLLALALGLPFAAQASSLPTSGGGGCTLQPGQAQKAVDLVYNNVMYETPARLDDMLTHLSPNVIFKDPMMATQGRAQFRQVFAQFITTNQITYQILGWSCSGRTVYLDWIFGTKGKITQGKYVAWEGLTKLVIGPDNLLAMELDNWNEVPPDFLPYLRK